MPRRKPHSIRLTRIIRDSANAALDYFIPAYRADLLYRQGRLVLVECYSSEWTYATRTRHDRVQ
jgi:hypothetical protein